MSVVHGQRLPKQRRRGTQRGSILLGERRPKQRTKGNVLLHRGPRPPLPPSLPPTSPQASVPEIPTSGTLQAPSAPDMGGRGHTSCALHTRPSTSLFLCGCTYPVQAVCVPKLVWVYLPRTSWFTGVRCPRQDSRMGHRTLVIPSNSLGTQPKGWDTGPLLYPRIP